jgi:hypothetical protein
LSDLPIYILQQRISKGVALMLKDRPPIQFLIGLTIQFLIVLFNKSQNTSSKNKKTGNTISLEVRLVEATPRQFECPPKNSLIMRYNINNKKQPQQPITPGYQVYIPGVAYIITYSGNSVKTIRRGPV